MTIPYDEILDQLTEYHTRLIQRATELKLIHTNNKGQPTYNETHRGCHPIDTTLFCEQEIENWTQYQTTDKQ